MQLANRTNHLFLSALLWAALIVTPLRAQDLGPIELNNVGPSASSLSSYDFDLNSSSACRSPIVKRGTGDIVNDRRLVTLVEQSKYQEAIWLLHELMKEPLEDGVSLQLEILVENYHRALESILLSELDEYKSRSIGRGVTGAQLVALGSGIKGVFKSDDGGLGASSDAEVATFMLDQLFRLNIVPRTGKTLLAGKVGSIQYFVGGQKERYLPMSELSPAMKKRVQAGPEYRKLQFLDYLIENYDRHQDNYLVGESSGKIVAIDNGWGFPGKRAGIRWPHLRALRNLKMKVTPENYFSSIAPPADVYLLVKGLNLDLVRDQLKMFIEKDPLEGEEIVSGVISRILMFKEFFAKPGMESRYYGH